MAIWLALFSTLLPLSAFLDWYLLPKYKAVVAVLTVPGAEPNSWPEDATITPQAPWLSILTWAYLAVYDKLLDVRRPPYPSLLRSGLISFAVVYLCLLFWVFSRPESFGRLYDTIGVTNVLFLPVSLLPLFFGLTLIQDYFSLIETRLIVGRLPVLNSTFATLGALILDFLLTCLIFLIPFTGFLIVGEGLQELPSGLFLLEVVVQLVRTVPELPCLLPELLALSTDLGSACPGFARRVGFALSSTSVPLGVFFYSTFLTSVWLWLSIVLSLVVHLLRKPASTNLWQAKRIERAPFKYGAVMLLLVTLPIAAYLSFIL